MNIQKFDELMSFLPKASLQQELSEWQMFLEFVDVYFKNRNIKPVIVEIGVYNNHQKSFYEQLLGAEHIGIDIKAQPNHIAPDILGDSHDIDTIERLKTKLNGRMIDLLFIDGNHTYNDVRYDYMAYGPLTKHIIAFHNINTAKLNQDDPIGVINFWQELFRMDKKNILLTIQKDNIKNPNAFNEGRQMGIGLIIKMDGP